ncbi:MAG: UDP-glucose/GDP-mannose dehydrogenase family protein [Actinobacteria bacterium]|nr:UDP-glucose/GDP-mannose dehydrogenase family protein [Actinomycetota bacterium]
MGTGYVGITTAASMASLGHDVIGIDIDADKVERLNRAEVPILEPGLPELVRDGVRQGHLRFTTEHAAVGDAEFVFLCVPTPPAEDGRADLSHLLDAARTLAPHLQPDSVVINKSTVPVGSCARVERELGRQDVYVVSNPEFLREGHAVQDCLQPDRLVIGSADEAAAIRVFSLYRGVVTPLVVTDPATAELTKYAANAFLATKLSFINSIAAICEEVGADIGDVVLGMGHDKRIGAEFLRPGPGWGGSCFPKDTRALDAIARDAGYDFTLLRETIAVNEAQKHRVVEKVERLVPDALADAKVAVWGLTFKAGTDDLRESPSLAVIEQLVAAGADVHAHDPAVDVGTTIEGVTLHKDPLDALDGAHALVVMTEWDDYRWIDPDEIVERMSTPNVVDTRNLLNRASLSRAGCRLVSTGRS